MAVGEFQALRKRIPAHPFGLVGIDHVAMAARDPELASEFYIQVLGATPFRKFAETYPNGQTVTHAMVHLGTVLVQLAYPPDGHSFPDPLNTTPWPHWAFGTTPEGVLESCRQLERHGVPYNGPFLHRSNSTSIYFKDTEGNKLEITTWDDFPPDKASLMGTEYGFPRWSELNHSWRPSGTTS